MKLDIYKTLKFEGKPVTFETDTNNIYTSAGDFLCVGHLDDKGKLCRSQFVAGIDGKLIETPIIKK